MSVLRYALLGVLARSPRTGYELSKVMARPVAYFWSANHSQIYPELRRMESAGLIEAETVPGPGPRDTRRLSITAGGASALRAWLRQPSPVSADRDEFVVRVHSLWLLDPQEAGRLVEDHRQLHADRLAVYEAVAQEFADPPEPLTPDFASYATLQAGLSYQRHRIAWCDWLLEQLARVPSQTG